ncbi:MAG: hypothetical protein U1E30_05150 [Rhodoblastus sp.]
MKDAYKSLIEALAHGGMANRVKVNLDWIRRCSRAATRASIWNMSTAFSCPAASASAAPKARFWRRVSARERKVPYFGICFGMQMACIEAARALAGVPNAGSTEFGATPSRSSAS